MTDSNLTGISNRRKGRSLFAGALFFSGIVALVPLPGWTPRAATQEQTVTLDVAVIEPDADAYGSLTKDEFTVYEDGMKQQVISLKAQDSPFSLGIAIDASGSMREQLPLIQKTALNVISQMGGADEAFVAAFTARSEVIQDFTSNQRDLVNAVSKIYAKGATALLDAIVSTSGYSYKKGKHRRKALLFITDGLEKGSFADEDKAVSALIENQEQAYFVCVPVEVSRPFSGTKTSLKPRERVDRIARATGGQSFYLRDVEESASTTAKLIGSLRHQYEITYAPTNNKQNDKMRNVRVVVSPKDGRHLNVITRQGYYGPGHKGMAEREGGKEKS
ncbi:MAG TPA: VWA domain-containing protein [Blastocatellia bacterium]|nr:VWA domain-containing protein [Blastocatellia bacterium]